MKKTLTTIIALLGFICLADADNNSNSNTLTQQGKTFVSTATARKSQDIATDYIYRTADGGEYPIYLHQYSKGEHAGQWAVYIIRTSQKSGNEYRYYIKGAEGEQITKALIKAYNIK